MMSRVPPEEVREALRREVNFGCPVRECGVPYLIWHHFDPPWKVREHHDPKGMIALCATHAGLADGGRWTIDQIRKMKMNPFVTRDRISETYGYLRRNIVCIAGVVSYEVPTFLEINNERVIGFNRDSEGYNRMNVFIRDREGSPTLEMKNNFWTAYSRELHDLSCTARGK